MFRVIMTKSSRAGCFDRDTMSLVVTDLGSITKCKKENNRVPDFVTLSKNIFFVKKGIWPNRPPISNGNGGTFDYVRLITFNSLLA